MDKIEVNQITPKNIIEYTVEIMNSYLMNNTVRKDEISEVLNTVYKTVCSLLKESNNLNVPLSTLSKNRPISGQTSPAVPIEESVFDDYIICLEDGKKLKTLRRHLGTVYNMSPDESRRKWNLPNDYPLTAPNYSKKRKKIAKSVGLGQLQKNKKKVA